MFCSIIVLIFTFCKKKSATPAPESTTNAPTYGGPYSYHTTTRIIRNTSGLITRDSAVSSYFYDTPNGGTMINGGNVTVNSVSLTPSSTYYYSSFGLPKISGTLNWNVAGSGTVTAFAQAFIPSYPNYSGVSSLPDTCIKANGMTINVNGVTNNTSQNISVLISQYNPTFNYTSKAILGKFRFGYFFSF